MQMAVRPASVSRRACAIAAATVAVKNACAASCIRSYCRQNPGQLKSAIMQQWVGNIAATGRLTGGNTIGFTPAFIKVQPGARRQNWPLAGQLASGQAWQATKRVLASQQVTSRTQPVSLQPAG